MGVRWVWGLDNVIFSDDIIFGLILQSYGIKLGFGGMPGPSGGRDGAASQGGGCCS